jgi:hypothetical protein
MGCPCKQRKKRVAPTPKPQEQPEKKENNEEK